VSSGDQLWLASAYGQRPSPELQEPCRQSPAWGKAAGELWGQGLMEPKQWYEPGVVHNCEMLS